MTLTKDQQTLAEENLGLVHACAGRFTGRGIEYEDLVGAGNVGLVKAAAGFDPGRGFRFSTYAVPALSDELGREPTVSEIAAKAGTDPHETAVLLSASLPPVSLTGDENDETDLPVPSHEDAVIASLDLGAALTRLDEAERTLLDLRFRGNLTQCDVALRLGMTQVQVSRAEKRILLKLRRLME